MILSLEVIELYLDEFMTFKGQSGRQNDFGSKAFLTNEDNRLQAVGNPPQIFSLKTFKPFHLLNTGPLTVASQRRIWGFCLIYSAFFPSFSLFSCLFSFNDLLFFFLPSFLVSLDLAMTILLRNQKPTPP